MRLARLHLGAYGRFTDAVLEFTPVGGRDLHLVFGPNEAGKTTLLNAVTDLLFGFEHLTPFGFRHAARDLRIGATLQVAGEALNVVRRKGRKQTLFALDPHGRPEDARQPLPEDTLAPVLTGLDRTTYRMLFGLDLEALTEGGEALLAGEGDVGQSLFQAAAGLSVLRSVGDALRRNADELYKPRASSLPLNKALATHARIVKDVRALSVRSSAWEEAEQRLRQARGAHEDLVARRLQARETQTRLHRIRANLPHLARLRELAAAVDGLRDVPRLPDDARERREHAEAQLRTAQGSIESAAAELERLAAARAEVRVDEPLLARAEVLDALYRRLEAYANARDELARAAARRAVCSARVRAALDDVAPDASIDDAARYLPGRALIQRPRALVNEHLGLAARHDNLVEQRVRSDAAARTLRAALDGMPQPCGVDAAAAALATLEPYPALRSLLQDKTLQVAQAEAGVHRMAAELGFDDPAAPLRMAVPTRAAVAAHQASFERVDRARAEQHALDARLEGELNECRTEMRALEAGGEVVTQAQVASARARRDQSWQSIRREHVDGMRASGRGVPRSDGGVPTADAFEHALREADRLADHLHADAQRATRYAGLATRLEQTQDERARAVAAAAQLEQERDALDRRWQALCAPLRLEAPTPEVVLEWIARRERLAERAEQLAAQQAERDALAGRVASLASVASAALAACGLPEFPTDGSRLGDIHRLREHHGAMLALAAQRTAALERWQEKVEEADRLERERMLAARALDDWAARWRMVLTELRVAPDLRASEAEAMLDAFERLRAACDELEDVGRMDAEQSALAADFEGGLRSLRAFLGEAPPALAPEVEVRALYARLREARDAQVRLKSIEKSIEHLEAQLRRHRDDANAARRIVSELARSAGCAEADLPRVEAQAQRRLRLESECAQVERALMEANGRPVAEVAEEAGTMDVDALTRDATALAERLERLDREIRSAQDAETEAQSALSAIDGGAAAAELQQEQAAVAAEIHASARDWSRARLAHALLDRVVQQYRERHQGPLLTRASEIFRIVTCGSFAELIADYEDEGRILIGMRPSGERVPVAGMSKGTRDQLYLALRLATIEMHLAARGPIPVVVDDLLVQFDDQRALATLHLLHELSARTQVLFFTHHEHLITLLDQAGLSSAVCTHRLDRARVS